MRLRAPDGTTAWVVVGQIAAGEYRYEGLTPQRSWSVIDVGANIGVYSLWAARQGATVVAFEPEPEAFACLTANTSRTSIRTVHAAVVGSPRATAQLYLSDTRSTRNTLTGREIETGQMLHTSVDVPAITLDEVLVEGCDLLKMDCEGAEFEILTGVSDEALSRVPRIILEFHRSVGDPKTLINRLDAAGFATTMLVGESSREAVGLIGAVHACCIS